MTINTNAGASSAALQLSRSQEMLTRSLNKLSSGNRIVQPPMGKRASPTKRAPKTALDAAKAR